MKIKIVKNSKQDQVYIDDTNISDKCADVDCFTKPGEPTRVVMTFEPDDFIVTKE